MNRSELSKRTLAQLLKLASAAKVSGTSRMTRGELIDALSRKRPEPVKARTPAKAKKRLIEARSAAKRPAPPKRAPRKAAAPPPVQPAPAPSAPPVPAPQPPAPGPVYVERGPDLPNQYGAGCLVAMVRDPHWVFLYWDLSGGVCDQIAKQYGAEIFHRASWVLRIYPAGGEPRDVAVVPEARNWYVSLADGVTYVFELGLNSPEHGFIRILRSNEVATPRYGISEVVDEEWRTLEEDYLKMLEMAGLLGGPSSQITSAVGAKKPPFQFLIPGSSAISSRRK